MCRLWRSAGSEMTLEELDRLLRKLHDFGIAIIEVSGGEPFERSDIFEILDLLDRYGFAYTLNTNGIALTSDCIRRLERLQGLIQLAVSVDSLDRSRYATLRGVDKLDDVLGHLAAAARIPRRFPMKINFTMSRLNYRETGDLLKYADELGLYLSVFPVNQYPQGAHSHVDGLFQASPEERNGMADVFNRLSAVKKRGAPLWEFSRFYDLAARYVLGEPLGQCGAGVYFIDIRSDGTLGVCIEQSAAMDALNGEPDRIRDFIREQKPRVEECGKHVCCCYTCTYNISLSRRYIWTFLKEILIMKSCRMFGGLFKADYRKGLS